MESERSGKRFNNGNGYVTIMPSPTETTEAGPWRSLELVEGNKGWDSVKTCPSSISPETHTSVPDPAKPSLAPATFRSRYVDASSPSLAWPYSQSALGIETDEDKPDLGS